MSWTKARSELANAVKKDPSADVTDLRRNLKTERLAEHIARVVDEAPPLTAEQRDRLALLLRSKGGSPPGNARQGRPAPGRIGRIAPDEADGAGGSDAT